METLLLPLLLLSSSWTSCRPASLTVTPSWSQHFEYERLSFSCPGGWTVWRYTNDGSDLSQCDSGWGTKTSSTCIITSLKPSYSGVYWCQSKHGDSSNTANITVIRKTSQTTSKHQPVILQSPVLPVKEGHHVTLKCRTGTSTVWATFYRDGDPITTGPTDHMTLTSISRSDEGAYKCVMGDVESPSSWLLIRDDSEVASLTLKPDVSQLPEYSSLSLSCGHNSSVHGWRIVRFTNYTKKMSTCGQDWGTVRSGDCFLGTVKQHDSAVYWCETLAKRRTNSVNISVYGFRTQPVILQSPVLPVMEGDNVTLSCRTETPNLSAHFYRDDTLLSSELAGHMTLQHVSRSDEGRYRCHISGLGKSPPSWLFVRAREASDPQAGPTMSPLRLIRHIVVSSPYIISTALVVSLLRNRPAGKKPAVSMATCPAQEEDEGLDQDDVTTEHHF
ncbi:high affinity immunoglobulin gamma Fc receptor I-like [Cololabis saira]|uniref:high affinity immunoglobulin gamma Fc receptor I-like n=1 Tax=Cololabis saira TaxID=129043 RepID=UPI002AD4FCA2|nr:high affinity immunoglobulin gamma Fc receptor I-like [Cololabis saira]